MTGATIKRAREAAAKVFEADEQTALAADIRAGRQDHMSQVQAALNALADQPSPPVVEGEPVRNLHALIDGETYDRARAHVAAMAIVNSDPIAAIALLSSPTSVREAEQRAIALVRRIAAKESWQSHYGRTWEDEAAEIVAALAQGGEVENG